MNPDANPFKLRSFQAAATPPPEPEPAYWFAFVGNRLLVQGTPPQIPHCTDLSEFGLKPLRSLFLGKLGDRSCYGAELPPDLALPSDPTLPSDLALCGLRELYGSLPEDGFALAGRAIQLVEWHRTHQFCGHCATPTIQLATERAKRCPNCGLVCYPRLSPAVIVRVDRGEELLLARASRFPEGMYSVLAGFVEPGESLEDTIEREIWEEVGVSVTNIRYFGSQPWPFPNSLMIGFTADYASGEVQADGVENVAAAWFHKSNLPKIPPPLSIARKLIDAFLAD